MPLFGAHMSVAGGVHHALEAAHDHACTAVQLFTRNANRWQSRPLPEKDVVLFRSAMIATGMQVTAAHDSYLINLASMDDALYQKSVAAFEDELLRAESLGLNYLVTHPGAHLGNGEEAALARVAAALDAILERLPDLRVRVLLETTAGQGTSLGHRFEHLGSILQQMRQADRVGVCLDTCHVFAAGYPLAPESDYQATVQAFDDLVGLRKLEMFHVNDSLKPLGSRVDRHAHIGKGHLGLEPFRLLVNDSRFANHAMILETAKEEGEEKGMDAINLAALRGLVGSNPPS